ncbi:MAG: NAD(P)-dependent oxidoreductase [Bacteroidota bacterium]
MKIGIIKEGKTPPDSRVPMTPAQCQQVLQQYPVELIVAPSPGRCFTDQEYQEAKVPLSDDMASCDVLMGVKEVPIDQLIPHKTYFFFSHTIKEQPYNRALLQAVLQHHIRLIDYEVLTDELGRRLIAFGRFAGMVGAHNGLLTYGRRTGHFNLKRMKDCRDYAEATRLYQSLQLPPMKIVLTGTGRVANGAAQVLKDMGIRQVPPAQYLQEEFQEAVFTQLDCEHYAEHKEGQAYSQEEFFAHPQRYRSSFAPYTKVSDIMINGIYWDNAAPAFFTREEAQADDFRIQVIADVTCDIAPVSSIPSTLRASTIADPIFGYAPASGTEVAPHSPNSIDMMTIDNLPNELPRDASKAFGEQFMEHILEELLQADSKVIERATVAVNGLLGPHFGYLAGYVAGGQDEA